MTIDGLGKTQTTQGMKQDGDRAQCWECESNCPQHVQIGEWMPRVHAVLGEGRPYPGKTPWAEGERSIRGAHK
jgi:hypothetical protein